MKFVLRCAAYTVKSARSTLAVSIRRKQNANARAIGSYKQKARHPPMHNFSTAHPKQPPGTNWKMKTAAIAVADGATETQWRRGFQGKASANFRIPSSLIQALPHLVTWYKSYPQLSKPLKKQSLSKDFCVWNETHRNSPIHPFGTGTKLRQMGCGTAVGIE